MLIATCNFVIHAIQYLIETCNFIVRAKEVCQDKLRLDWPSVYEDNNENYK